MPKHKEHSAHILALVYLAGLSCIFVVSGLYLVFSKDRIAQARWYASASHIYLEKSQQSIGARKKPEYLNAAKESQFRALRAQPFDPALWQGLADIFQEQGQQSLKEQAQDIINSLSSGAGENP